MCRRRKTRLQNQIIRHVLEYVQYSCCVRGLAGQRKEIWEIGITHLMDERMRIFYRRNTNGQDVQGSSKVEKMAFSLIRAKEIQ